MRRNTESISQSVAAKLIRELRTRGYGATPINMSSIESSWDINKIWVTRSSRDLCDINYDNKAMRMKKLGYSGMLPRTHLMRISGRS